MPVDKIKVQHKFGIISHNHRQNLLERITAPPTPVGSIRKPTPCEISHDFILSYNNADPLDRSKFDIQASQLLQRVKRRAGLLSGGSGKHVHIPRAWVELTLLARCKGPFRDDVLKILVASLLTAPTSIDNIPSLFLVSETAIEWIKELGNPIPETAWSNTQVLTYHVTELCFWRIYYHSLLHNLQGCDSFLSDLSWHIENLDFIRKVYSKYPDGELLLRQLESTKSVITKIFPQKDSTDDQNTNFLSAGLMHGLDFYQSVRSCSDPAVSLSALLTTLSLLGTEGYLNTVLVMKLLTTISCKNYLALQILQAASTGTLPLQGDSAGKGGVFRTSFQHWDWIVASDFINLLVYVALNGDTSEIQRSALKAGEMTSVRVDSAPVQGYGLLDLVALNTAGLLGPAVQYALQQGLTRVHIHVKTDPLRKSAAHMIWSALQTMKNCPSHRIIVGIAQRKAECSQSIQSQVEVNSKLLFELIFESLSEHYIPQSVSAQSVGPTPRKSKTVPKIVQPPAKPVSTERSKISVVSKPGSLTKLMNSSRSFECYKQESYINRNDKILKDVVADQWYKELMDVFRASERAQQSVVQCEEYSATQKTHAEVFVDEMDLSESEVCKVMDRLVVKQ